jgi:PhnB protein
MSSYVTPVPDGFHTITPSLIVNDAVKAIEFYKSALGAEELQRMATPDGSKVMHSEVRIGNSIFFVVDEFPEMGQKSPSTLGGTPISLNLYVEDADAAFDRAVKAGARVLMPVEEMFWGDRFGMVADPFGHIWCFATHVKEPSLEEIMEGARAAFGEAGT